MTKPDASSSVKSATRTLDILEFMVGWKRPVAATDIGAALAIPISSLSYLLATLVERNYLARDGRLYVPGEALERLGAASGHRRSLIDRVEPLVRNLSAQLDETTAFFVREDFEAEALCSATSQQALRYAIDPGQRVPMHAFSGGKVLLAGMSDAELEAYFAQSDRLSFQSGTITAEPILLDQIRAIRAGALATTREEHTQGINGFAVPVIAKGVTIGSLSIAVPAARVTPELEQRIDTLLRRTASLIADD